MKPESEYAKNAKFNVVYSPNEKFTVVLVLDPQLKEAWHTTSSIAFQRLNMMMGDEFAYHHGNTLLVRKLTKKFS